MIHEHELEFCDDCRSMWLSGHKSALAVAASDVAWRGTEEYNRLRAEDHEPCDRCYERGWSAGFEAGSGAKGFCYACELARNAPNPQAAEFCLKHAPNVHGADACAWGGQCGCERRATETLDTRGHPIAPRDGIPPSDDEVIACPGDCE